MTLGDRIAAAARAGAEGDAWVRERTTGRVHRITLRGGRVVAARFAGRFDPILQALLREGALGEEAYWDVLEALGTSERRAGDLAVEIGGVPPERVRAIVEAQVRARVQRALGIESDASGFEQRTVRPREAVVGIAAIELVRGSVRARAIGRVPAPAPAAAVPTAEARRRLRLLARELHPDRHASADPAVRVALAARLARATAAFHGF